MSKMFLRRTVSKYLLMLGLFIVYIICFVAEYKDEYKHISKKELKNKFKKLNKHNVISSSRSVYSYDVYNNDSLADLNLNYKLAENDLTWLQLSKDLYIYSAFWDTRDGIGKVRSVGIMRFNESYMIRKNNFVWTGIVKDGALNYSCYLWFENEIVPQKGKLEVFVYEEALKEFVGAFFFCSQNKSASEYAEPPYAVSYVPNDDPKYSHKLIYLFKNLVPKKSVNYSVCVRAFYGPFNDAKHLLEFIIYYYEVIGVRSFYFYDFSITNKIKQLLLKLKYIGLKINLLRWNLPTSNWDELWDLGSLSLLNDCLYRTMDNSNFTIFVDLDEFIVPQLKEDKIEDLYRKTLTQKRGNNGDAMLILNGFFCSDFKKLKKYDINEKEDLTIFKYTIREGRLWPPEQRSKIVVKPEFVLSVGHHMVHRFVNSTLKNHGTSKFFAVLNHYRSCDGVQIGIHGKGAKVVDSIVIKDVAIFKYKKNIFNSKIYQYFQIYI